jgi:heme A synthase
VLEDSATAIEFVHRLTSGIALIAVVVLLVWARRLFPAGHRVRAAAVASTVFIVIEALIGAALVLFGWVEDDTSIGRVVSIAVHLGNTFLLLASLTATAWWASGGRPIEPADASGYRRERRLLVGALLALVVIAALGAITALGDTLFPPGEPAEESARAQFLIRLRVIHPVLAVLTGGYLVVVARHLAGLFSGTVMRLATAVSIIVGVQIAAGVLTIALEAPLWMQLVHLVLADLLWITVVLLALVVFAGGRDPREAPSPPSERLEVPSS